VTANGVAQLLFYLIVLVALAKPLGAFMARVYEGRPCGLDRALGWLERLIYRVGGVRPGNEMGWKTYAIAMLLFNAAGMLFKDAVLNTVKLVPNFREFSMYIAINLV